MMVFHQGLKTFLNLWIRVLLETVTVCLASQETPFLLWNSKVHYHVHNSPPPVSSHSTHFHDIFLRSISILSFRLYLNLPSCPLLWGFTTKMYIFMISLMGAPNSNHLIRFNLIIAIIQLLSERYKL